MTVPTPLLDEAAISEYLGVPANTLKAWRRRRQGPPYVHVNSTHLVRYRLSDVDRWLDEQTVVASS